MLVIRKVDPSFAVGLCTESLTAEDMTPGQCEAFCQEKGLVALAAERDDDLAGFAVAESSPKAVHFLMLEGDSATCRILLDRLVRLAGERDVSGWCPVGCGNIRKLLEERGFTRTQRSRFLGCPCFLYHWHRNADVDLASDGAEGAFPTRLPATSRSRGREGRSQLAIWPRMCNTTARHGETPAAVSSEEGGRVV